MAQMMKAAVVREFGKPLVIEEMPIPEPGPGQILVKYEATGVCHTDLHAANGDWPVKPNPPFIPGHEGVGYVAKLGCWRVAHQGRRSGWRAVAAHRLRLLQSLPHRLGNALRQPAEHRLFRQRNLRAIRPGRSRLCRPPAGQSGIRPAAPVLCAGVTVYKGLKETEVRPGEWVVISGIGGLGHMAVQYAKAMGMHVVAADIFDDKLELAKKLGADVTVNGRAADAIEQVQKATGGVHGALVTAVSPKAMEQAYGFLRSKGTMSLVGLPPGFISLPVFDTVLKRITVRGSIVGTRQDLEESLMFAGEGKVASHFSWDKIENINAIFHRMEEGKIDGRIVLDLAA